MRVVDLKNPQPNGYATEDDPVALKLISDILEVRQSIANGTLFVRYIDGDRKGSIARVIRDPKLPYGVDKEPSMRHSSNSWNRANLYRIDGEYTFGLLAVWDGRRNKVQLNLPSRDVEILLDYEGPTVWEKFDANAAKQEILKEPDQRDIDDNVLAIGDKVMYINARYGSRMTLERGTIKEFKVVVDSKSHTIHTIITSEDGTESALAYPESMVYRIQGNE